MRRILKISIVTVLVVSAFLLTAKVVGSENAEPPLSETLERFEGQKISALVKENEPKLAEVEEVEVALASKPTGNSQNRAITDDYLLSEVSRLSEKYQLSQGLVEAIIVCESGNRPHVVGTLAYVGVDVGYWQINTHYHLETSLAMGLDIYDPADNLEYGFWLLATEGTRHWNASKHCWSMLL